MEPITVTLAASFASFADPRLLWLSQAASCDAAGVMHLRPCARVSDKAMLASDFMWNWNARQAQARSHRSLHFVT